MCPFTHNAFYFCVPPRSLLVGTWGGGLEADCHNSFITLNITPPALSSFFRSPLTPSFFFFTSYHLYFSLVLSTFFHHPFHPSVYRSYALTSPSSEPGSNLPKGYHRCLKKREKKKKTAKCICILFPTSTAWPSVFIAHWQTANGSQWCVYCRVRLLAKCFTNHWIHLNETCGCLFELYNWLTNSRWTTRCNWH